MKARVVVDEQGHLVALELGTPKAPGNGPETVPLQAGAGQTLHEVEINGDTAEALINTIDHETVVGELRKATRAVKF